MVREYPAKSMAALICPRASPSRASRKSSCLGVRVFVMTLSQNFDISFAGGSFDSDRNALGSFLQWPTGNDVWPPPY